MDRTLTFKTKNGQERIVWGERREPSPTDDVTVGHGVQLWEQEDAIYKVRSLGDIDYAVGHTFTDEDGNTRRIRGLRKVGRAFYEILGRIV